MLFRAHTRPGIFPCSRPRCACSSCSLPCRCWPSLRPHRRSLSPRPPGTQRSCRRLGAHISTSTTSPTPPGRPRPSSGTALRPQTCAQATVGTVLRHATSRHYLTILASQSNANGPQCAIPSLSADADPLELNTYPWQVRWGSPVPVSSGGAGTPSGALSPSGPHARHAIPNLNNLVLLYRISNLGHRLWLPRHYEPGSGQCVRHLLDRRSCALQQRDLLGHWCCFVEPRHHPSGHRQRQHRHAELQLRPQHRRDAEQMRH